MPRIEVSSDNWLQLFKNAIANSENSSNGDHISDVDFRFDHIDRYHTRWNIILDSEVIPIGELHITNLNSFRTLRDWIERSVLYDNFNGSYNPEMCNIECMTTSYTIIIFHRDFKERTPNNNEAVSRFIILDKIRSGESINCKCYTLQTLARLYRALLGIKGRRMSKAVHSKSIEKNLINYLY